MTDWAKPSPATRPLQEVPRPNENPPVRRAPFRYSQKGAIRQALYVPLSRQPTMLPVSPCRSIAPRSLGLCDPDIPSQTHQVARSSSLVLDETSQLASSQRSVPFIPLSRPLLFRRTSFPKCSAVDVFRKGLGLARRRDIEFKVQQVILCLPVKDKPVPWC